MYGHQITRHCAGYERKMGAERDRGSERQRERDTSVGGGGELERREEGGAKRKFLSLEISHCIKAPRDLPS